MASLSNRYLSIDVMRGMTVFLMIVVNMSISNALAYGQLLHTVWHGFTLTDAVFPTFLFVVGAAMGFTQARYAALGTPAFVKKVLTRAALIFCCGLFVSNFPFFRLEAGHLVWQALDSVRILGVLQRIGLTYAIASLMLYFVGKRGALVYAVVVIIGYWAVMAGFGDFSLQGNAALKLDALLLGASHLYKGEGIPFDPEGILGTFPSVVNVLAGYFAISYLRASPPSLSVVAKIAGCGLGLLGVALLINPWFPINKKLWTSTFVLFTIGIDLLVLAALTYVIDHKQSRVANYYFEVFGKNTLAIYILAEVLMALAWTLPIGDRSAFMWIYDYVFAHLAPAKLAGLLYALVFVQLCWLVGFWMDRQKIYIRL